MYRFTEQKKPFLELFQKQNNLNNPLSLTGLGRNDYSSSDNLPAVMGYQKGYETPSQSSTYSNPLNIQWGGNASIKGGDTPYYLIEDTIKYLNNRYGMPEDYRPQTKALGTI